MLKLLTLTLLLAPTAPAANWRKLVRPMVAASCVASAADGYWTVRGLGQAHELNPLFRNPASVVAIKAGLCGGMMLASRRRDWQSYVLGVAVGHAVYFGWAAGRDRAVVRGLR